MILGKISSVDSTTGVKVIIDGEDTASTKKYSYLASYTPTAGDRVLIEEINGSYVILGKLCTRVDQSGIVRQAANATNAAHATSADSATNATNATKAQTAVTATNATNATTAASCSGNSRTATYANSATVSDSTNALGNGVGSVSGMLVTYVGTRYLDGFGTVVTNVSTTSYKAFAYKGY